MKKMTWWHLGIVIAVQVALSITIFKSALEGIEKGFPLVVVSVLSAAWLMVCVWIDVKIWHDDIKGAENK